MGKCANRPQGCILHVSLVPTGAPDLGEGGDQFSPPSAGKAARAQRPNAQVSHGHGRGVLLDGIMTSAHQTVSGNSKGRGGGANAGIIDDCMGIAGGTNIAIGGSGWTPSRRGQPVIAATAAAKHDGASVPKTHAMFFGANRAADGPGNGAGPGGIVR